jgi:hypothetical protein
MKKINMKFVFALIFCSVLILNFVSAVDFDDDISDEDKATFDEILVPVMKIYNLIKYTATVFAALALLLAGFNYMMGGSDPKKRETAKGTAMYVVIGLLVIWAAPLVVNFIVG